MNDRSALQVPHDREKAPIRLTVTDQDLINADRLDFRCVNCCKLVAEIPLLNVFYRVPSQVKVAGQRSNADLFPEPKDRLFELS